MPKKVKAPKIKRAKTAKKKEQKFPFATLRNPEDPRDLRHADLMGFMVAATPLPPKFSVYNASIEIINQLYGSCVGASHSKEAEYEQAKEEGVKKLPMDYQWLYAMCKRFDGSPDQEGTWPRVAGQVRVDYGVLPMGVWPDNRRKTATHKEFIEIPEDLEELFATKAYPNRSNGFVSFSTVAELRHLNFTQNDPVTITIPIYENYLATDKDGVVLKPTGNQIGLHRVLVTGYDDEKRQIEIVNSWSEGFGLGGRCYYSYDLPFWDGQVSADYVEGKATSGSPVDLAMPVDKAFVIQTFGADWIDPKTGGWYYRALGLNGHPGLDLRQSDGQGKIGDPIYACDEGKVIYAANRGPALGNTIIIQHSWGTSHYNHLNAGRVAIGQVVKKRERIGDLGKTGKVTGPHLHFGITINGVSNPGFGNFVDPAPYFKSSGKIADYGVAKVANSPLQVFYVKIGTPVFSGASEIAKMPEHSLMLGKDKKTVMFVKKLSSLEAKEFIKKGFAAGSDEPNLQDV